MASTTIQSETSRINYVDYVGDTIVMEFAYKSDNILVDLTQVGIVCEVRKLQTDLEPFLTFSKANGRITSHSTANICLTISNSETRVLGAGEFYYFVELTYPTGYINTLITGKLILKVR